MTDEEAIRALIDTRVAALEAGDAPAAVASLAADVVAFEVAGPLVIPAEQVRDPTMTEAWLRSFRALRIDITHMAVHVSGDVAFAHSLNRLTGTRTDGETVDFWMRSTLGLRRLGGEWKIVHGHTSVPR